MFAEWEIGPAGGTGETPDGDLKLVVPSGALDTTVTISATSVAATPPLVPGTVWSLEPDGLEFAVPAELTIRYDVGDVSGDENQLQLFDIRTDDTLEAAKLLSRDLTGKTVTAEVEHFSGKGLAVCPQCWPPPTFTVDYTGSGRAYLSWSVPTWDVIEIFRVGLRQCDTVGGETSGEYGDYLCVATPGEVLTPPPECVAPDITTGGQPCLFEHRYWQWGFVGGQDDGNFGSRGAVFWYMVRGGAWNTSFVSRFTSPESVTYFGTGDPPDAPENFHATPLSSSEIRLSWQPTPTASSYDFQRIDPATSWSLPFSAYDYTDQGRVDDTQYTYWMRSVNEWGTSGWVSATATTTAICRVEAYADGVEIEGSSPFVVPPGQPVTLRAAGCGDPQVRTFEWYYGSGGGGDSNLQGYGETYDVVGSAGSNSWTLKVKDGTVTAETITVTLEGPTSTILSNIDIAPGPKPKIYQAITITDAVWDVDHYAPITTVHSEVTNVHFEARPLVNFRPGPVASSSDESDGTWSLGAGTLELGWWQISAVAQDVDGNGLSYPSSYSIEVVQN